MHLQATNKMAENKALSALVFTCLPVLTDDIYPRAKVGPRLNVVAFNLTEMLVRSQVTHNVDMASWCLRGCQ